MKEKPDRITWDLAMSVERLLEGRLSPDETVILQDRIREEPSTREYVARLLRLHGEMKASVRDRTRDLNLSFPVTPPAPAPRRIHSGWLFGIAIAAILAAFVIPVVRKFMQPEISAVLIRSKFCRWDETSQPTIEGSSITAGHYALAEGMASFRFSNGTVVVLEGPSVLEIIDGDHCRLRKGSLMAEAPAGSDFTVEVPGIAISAADSQFGVSADGNGKYVVQAIRNPVKATTSDGTTTTVVEGDRFTDDDDPRNLPPHRSSESANLALSPSVLFDDGWHRVTTAFGRGADTFIRSAPWEDPKSPKPDFGHGRHPSLMVKSADDESQTNRQAYLRFDLGLTGSKGLENAELTLTLVPSALGFGSLVPDAHFRVYALTNESEDNWPETGITWKHAPGHIPDSPVVHQPDPARTIAVGDFTVPQGQTTGAVTLSGKALVDFLKTDTNGLATFIICRVTSETAQGGLVHAFASKEHESAQPPALKLKFADH